MRISPGPSAQCEIQTSDWDHNDTAKTPPHSKKRTFMALQNLNRLDKGNREPGSWQGWNWQQMTQHAPKLRFSTKPRQSANFSKIAIVTLTLTLTLTLTKVKSKISTPDAIEWTWLFPYSTLENNIIPHVSRPPVPVLQDFTKQDSTDEDMAHTSVLHTHWEHGDTIHFHFFHSVHITQKSQQNISNLGSKFANSLSC